MRRATSKREVAVPAESLSSDCPAPPPAPSQAQQAKVHNLKETIFSLREGVSSLKIELDVLERQAEELRIKAVCTETGKDYATAIHKQFIEGLQTGYNMVQSANMAAPFSNAPPSARMNRMPSHTGEESVGSAHSRNMRMGDDERNPFDCPYGSFH
eukprot:6195295-Pleurochrysis_carterae.AAC.3